jgi:hypothetical protein
VTSSYVDNSSGSIYTYKFTAASALDLGGRVSFWC